MSLQKAAGFNHVWRALYPSGNIYIIHELRTNNTEPEKGGGAPFETAHETVHI